MERITIEEFDLTHSAKDLSPEAFEILSLRAMDLTEELCFGRAGHNEPEARRAMKEMIAYWILRDKGAEGVGTVEKEAVGNYSVSRREEPVLRVHGVPVSPSALLILQRAGLRNHSV